MTQKQLAIKLTHLKVFSSPKIKEEQYPTDSNIAAEILWFAEICKDIEGKTIADLGAGTGILGIGCLLLGAKKVYFVEKDKDAIKVLKENLEAFEIESGYEIITDDIRGFDKKVDTVIQNPPFGTKTKHKDRVFLEIAMSIAKTVYSFHKAETKDFIDKYIHNSDFHTTNYFEFDFPLKNSMKQHKKKVEKIKVGCWRASR